MKNYLSSSIPHKLNIRQIVGSVKVRAGQKPFRFYEKCPETLQIPLKKIMRKEDLLRGHVAVGFTEDGRYFLTYTCNIRFQLTESSACGYKYTLFWWKFDLWRPLKKVHEVELFPNENISNEIHLMICQAPHSKFVVVHGSTFSVNCQSRRMCYVSVVPKFESKVDYSLHWNYELLPPYPPFVTSVSLKLPNVVLLNSGDMMFAVLIQEDLFSESRTEKKRHTIQNPDCYCQYNKKRRLNESDNRVNDTESSLNEADDRLNEADINLNKPDCRFNDVDTNVRNSDEVDDSVSSSSSEHCVDYVSYIRQGFTFPNEEQTQDSLPDSPFDCTATVIPCYLSSLCGGLLFKNVFEHRCFRSSDKGRLSDCQYFVSQVQFDAENFINEELQKNYSINRRFVSLRDYDMQMVDVCQRNSEVVILINALVVLRTSAETKSIPKNASSALKEHQASRLVLYTTGFLLSWNVYTGEVQVLQEFPLVERAGNICKSRHFSPSLSQTVQLRKKWFVPTRKEAVIQTLSNHTVFTGKSLQFLVHPVFPVAVVL